MRHFLLSLSALLIVASVHAQVPQIFSYQGVLAGTDGTALPDGAHTLLVRLYDDPTSGAVLWEESHDLQTISGVFSVVLGSKTELGIVFDRPLYLGVTVDGGAEQAPRIPLTASPYSLGTKTTVAEPETGQSFAVRNEEGSTAHVLSADGNVTHSGRGTFGGGLEVGLPAAAGKSADEATAGSFSGDVEILNNEALERPSRLKIEEVEATNEATGVLVWDEEDKVVRFSAVGDLPFPPGVGEPFSLPFAGAVDEAFPAFQVGNASGNAIAGNSENFAAIEGTSADGPGLSGRSTNDHGVLGRTAGGTAAGVRGELVEENTFGELGSADGGLRAGVVGFAEGQSTGGYFESSEGNAGEFHGDVVLRNRNDTSILQIDTVEPDADEEKVLVWDDDGSAGVTGAVRYKTLSSSGSNVPWELDLNDAIATGNDVDIKTGALVVTDTELSAFNRTLVVNGTGEPASVEVRGSTVLDGGTALATTLKVTHGPGGASMEVDGTTFMKLDDPLFGTLSVENKSGAAITAYGRSDDIAAIFSQGAIAASMEGDLYVRDGEGSTSILAIETVEEDPQEEKFLVWDDDGSAGFGAAVRFRNVAPGSGGWTDDGTTTSTLRDVSVDGGTLTVSEGADAVVTIDPNNELQKLSVNGPTRLAVGEGLTATLTVSKIGGGSAVAVSGRTEITGGPADDEALDVTNSGRTAIRANGATALIAIGDDAALLTGNVSIANGDLTIDTVPQDTEEDKFLVWDDDGSGGVADAVRYRHLPAGSSCVTCEEGGARLDGYFSLYADESEVITLDPSSTTKTAEINNPASSLGLGVNAGGTAVSGVSSGGTGVQGATTDGVGVRGVATGNGMAGDFQGDVGVTGTMFISEGISVSGEGTNFIGGDLLVNGTLSKGGGEFLIDHPLEPTEKVLRHSFVESPDMMNIYNGNVVLDERGEAWVELPEWFDALNNDFRYQLTCVGGFAPVFVADKIADNRFRIGGGSAGLEVSWQVTGIRDDPWARVHRIQVEEVKPAEQRGTYLHPDAYAR